MSTGQQSQLWTLVDGTPIDAGVFDADTSTFKEMKTVTQADTFAVTIEQQGGSTTPTLSTLQVIGNISS